MGIACVLVQLRAEEVERLRKEPNWRLERKLPDEQVLDVGKMWHCLHFLLTGSADPGVHPLNLFGSTVQQSRSGVQVRGILD